MKTAGFVDLSYTTNDQSEPLNSIYSVVTYSLLFIYQGLRLLCYGGLLYYLEAMFFKLIPTIKYYCTLMIQCTNNDNHHTHMLGLDDTMHCNYCNTQTISLLSTLNGIFYWSTYVQPICVV